jgi:hypothetical protein
MDMDIQSVVKPHVTKAESNALRIVTKRTTFSAVSMSGVERLE